MQIGIRGFKVVAVRCWCGALNTSSSFLSPWYDMRETRWVAGTYLYVVLRCCLFLWLCVDD